MSLALKATVYRVELEVADIDRGYYADHELTVARHPSETEERLMLRVLAFVMHADPALAFGRGVSTDDEPDLWQKDPTGAIEHWIDLGLPEERRVRRAAGRAGRVTLLCYGQRAFDVWWHKHGAALSRLDSLTVYSVTDREAAALAELASRNLKLQCVIQEGQITLGDGQRSVTVEPERILDGGVTSL